MLAAAREEAHPKHRREGSKLMRTLRIIRKHDGYDYFIAYGLLGNAVPAGLTSRRKAALANYAACSVPERSRRRIRRSLRIDSASLCISALVASCWKANEKASNLCVAGMRG